ncbi:MAG: Rieske (2Fe-2S) protein [Chthonomonadetes bacterium]|nr:Rieske (2Fe-2S) protein [Chthonomonadetes bacterium]
MSNNGFEHNDDQPNAVLRRRVLGWLVGVINLAVLGGIVAPVLGFISSPANWRQRRKEWIPVLDESRLRPGETLSVNYQVPIQDGYTNAQRKYSVYLYRRLDGSVVAFDPSCPHLGCRVEFRERKQRYICPCHGGVFDADGNLVSGPPPTGLTKLPVRVDAGKIWIRRV